MLRRWELINLWVFAGGVYPWDMVQQEESQPFQEGLWLWLLPQAFHPFIPQCPVGGSVALWAPWFWELHFPPSNGTSEVLPCTSCSEGFRPQSLLRLTLKNIHNDSRSSVWPCHPAFSGWFVLHDLFFSWEGSHLGLGLAACSVPQGGIEQAAPLTALTSPPLGSTSGIFIDQTLSSL